MKPAHPNKTKIRTEKSENIEKEKETRRVTIKY
jgi:hypothetical protein